MHGRGARAALSPAAQHAVDQPPAFAGERVLAQPGQGVFARGDEVAVLQAEPAPTAALFQVAARVVAVDIGEDHGEIVAVEQPATFGGFGGGSLVAEARRYLGTNPTGRSSLWCGAFMDKVLRETGHKGGGNLAKGYLHYGRRVSGPQVGAIAVMGRKGGGHVGVVSGVDANGNPIIVSGNHNHTVAESVYPRGRIIAYIEPNS